MMGVFDMGGKPPRHRGRRGKCGDYWKCDGCGKIVWIKKKGEWWPVGWVQTGRPKYGYFAGTYCPECVEGLP